MAALLSSPRSLSLNGSMVESLKCLLQTGDGPGRHSNPSVSSISEVGRIPHGVKELASQYKSVKIFKTNVTLMQANNPI